MTLATIRSDGFPQATTVNYIYAALGALIMRQHLKHERLSLKFQKQVSDHVYFRNISNNSGIFDYIVGAAEEQECKGAFLAYYFLLVASTPPDQEALDRRIEEWLSMTFGVDINFEVDDALAKTTASDC